MKKTPFVAKVIGAIPNRLQLAGGWIDQPFVSRHNPKPPGSMVVVAAGADVSRDGPRRLRQRHARRCHENCGMANCPNRPPEELVRELYEAENKGKAEPSGSQDMIGLVYPGINRLDYDFKVQRRRVSRRTSNREPRAAGRWLEKVLHLLPIEPRPEGYSPLGVKSISTRNGSPGWAGPARTVSTPSCRMDVEALGASLNDCMICWEKLLPHVVRHPLIKPDLKAMLKAYQKQYSGRDVFRLRRRLSHRRFQRTRSRRVQSERAPFAKIIMKASGKYFTSLLLCSTFTAALAQTNSFVLANLPPIAKGPFKPDLEFAVLALSNAGLVS